MRVPESALGSKAKVTVSFDAWKDDKVAAATFTLDVKGEPTDEEGKKNPAGP